MQLLRVNNDCHFINHLMFPDTNILDTYVMDTYVNGKSELCVQNNNISHSRDKYTSIKFGVRKVIRYLFPSLD